MKSVLVTRLDGLGDIVLASGLLYGLHRLYPDARLTLLVRPQLAGVAAILPEWVSVRPLAFDPRSRLPPDPERVLPALRQVAVECVPQLLILGEYNRVWAAELLARLCIDARVLSFDGPTGLNLHHRELLERIQRQPPNAPAQGWQFVEVQAASREGRKYQALYASLLSNDGVAPPAALGAPPRALPLPALALREADRQRGLEIWHARGCDERTIVVFPSSGDLLEKSLDAVAWLQVLQFVHERSGARPLLLASGDDERVLAALRDAGLDPRMAQALAIDRQDVGLLAALLERAAGYVGADTGPMHVSAVLNRPTLGIFGGGHAERFLPVGRRALAVRMPLGCYGCEWECPFEQRTCLKRMPLAPLLAAIAELLEEDGALAARAAAVFDERPPIDPASGGAVNEPRLVELAAPAGVDSHSIGAVARLHRTWLKLNHTLLEHHAFLEREQQARDGRLAALEAAQQENERRDQQLDALLQQTHRHLEALAEMTRQNQQRDAAIAELSDRTRSARLRLDDWDAQLAALQVRLGEIEALLKRDPPRARRAW